MSSMQSNLDRAGAWLERQNARDDKVAKGRPAWWNVGKIVFGALCFGRSISLAMHATGIGGYALALLFLTGGIYLAYEGATLLWRRR